MASSDPAVWEPDSQENPKKIQFQRVRQRAIERL
jgi:hypothetical protein